MNRLSSFPAALSSHAHAVNLQGPATLAGSFAPSNLTRYTQPYLQEPPYRSVQSAQDPFHSHWSAQRPWTAYAGPSQSSAWQPLQSRGPPTFGLRPPTPWNSALPTSSTTWYNGLTPTFHAGAHPQAPSAPNGLWDSLAQRLSGGLQSLWRATTDLPTTHMSRRPPKWPRPGGIYPGQTPTISHFRREGTLPGSQMHDECEDRISVAEGEWRTRGCSLFVERGGADE